MIDQTSRNRLRQESSNKNLMEGVKNALVEGFRSKGAEDSLKLVFEKHDDEDVKLSLSKVEKLLSGISNIIPRSINLPKVFNVEGKVEVTRSSPIEVKNLKELERYFSDMSTQIKMLAQAISSVPQQKIEFPKLELPKTEKLDLMPIVEAVEKLEKALNKGSFDKDAIPVLRNIQTSIQALVARPTLTPQPVTNVTLNALNGFVKTTSMTVGTSAVSLPDYGQLFNRRAVVIYNNSANTIYIGGSDVTTSNGMPVPANSYSPILDAGYTLIIYGVAAQSNNVRVLEISKDKTANVQQ